jgi:hypothetical protein
MPSYYNLPPAKYASDYNELEKALRAIPSETAKDALDLLEKLTRNVIQNETEEKFRRLRTTNAKLAPLFETPGAIQIMCCMGWQQEGEFVVLPSSVKLDFPNHIVKILEAKGDHDKKLAIKRGAAKLGRDPAKATLLSQLEKERQERASASVVSTTPLAQVPVETTPPVENVEDVCKNGDPAADVKETPTLLPSQCPNPGPTTTIPATNAGYTTSNPVEAPKPAAKTEPANDDGRKEMSLQDLRALQKAKYKEFEADPSARDSAAYKQPPSTGGSKEAGWFDWMWGGSSSNDSGGGSGGSSGKPKPQDRKPRIKGVADLPKPPPRAGG